MACCSLQREQMLRTRRCASTPTKAEVMRKALVLLKHAVAADKVKLVAVDGTEQQVLLK